MAAISCQLELTHQVVPVALRTYLDHVAGEFGHRRPKPGELVRARYTAAMGWQFWSKSVGDMNDVAITADSANLTRRCADGSCGPNELGVRITEVLPGYPTGFILTEQGFLGKKVVNAGNFTSPARS